MAAPVVAAGQWIRRGPAFVQAFAAMPREPDGLPLFQLAATAQEQPRADVMALRPGRPRAVERRSRSCLIDLLRVITYCLARRSEQNQVVIFLAVLRLDF